MTGPLIVARCGDLQNAPESTLPAFEGAIAKGADVIEFDVHATRDGALVVHHDYYLGRTSDGSGAVGDHTLEQLSALDAGAWFGPQFAGERIPTLSQVLDLGRGRVRFEIDLRAPDPVFLQQVLDRITRVGVMEDVELTSEHVPLLCSARQAEPQICVGLFFRPPPGWMALPLAQQHAMGWMVVFGAQVAHLHRSLVDARFVAALQAGGYRVHASNLNLAPDVGLGIEAGIDQLSTDRLELALSIRG